MKPHELNVTAKKSKTRVGRGISAGQGKTAGRGTKGQKSRTGKKLKAGFEGGQNPLMQRVPKLRGFRSFKVAKEVVLTGQLEAVKGIIDNFSLFESGLVTSPYSSVKLIVGGDVAKKHTVKLQAASKKAIEMVKKAGGSFDQVERVKREAKKTS